MSGRSFVSMYMGTPLLAQLNDDLRAAEMDREAPRLSVPANQYRKMCGETWSEGGKTFELVDNRTSHSKESMEATLFDRSLGTFRLVTGELAFYALLPTLV